jgi:hypothetical protein
MVGDLHGLAAVAHLIDDLAQVVTGIREGVRGFYTLNPTFCRHLTSGDHRGRGLTLLVTVRRCVSLWVRDEGALRGERDDETAFAEFAYSTTGGQIGNAVLLAEIPLARQPCSRPQLARRFKGASTCWTLRSDSWYGC